MWLTWSLRCRRKIQFSARRTPCSCRTLVSRRSKPSPPKPTSPCATSRISSAAPPSLKVHCCECARYLPRMKMDRAALEFYPAEGERDQGDHANRRQPERDVDVGEQPGLGDDIMLKELQRTRRGNTVRAAVAVNQIRVLHQSGVGGGVQTIRYVQEPRGMQRHAAIEQDRRRGDPKGVSELAHEKEGGGNVIDLGDRRVGGDRVSGREDDRPNAKSLQENHGSQNYGGRGGRPDVTDYGVGRDQDEHSAEQRAHGAQAGNQQVQSVLQSQPQSERIHGNKAARLQGAVI